MRENLLVLRDGKMSPLTVYLDTNIVSGLAKEDLTTDEHDALQHILEAYKQGKVSLVTSPITKEEIEEIPVEHRSKHETIYNLLIDVPIARTFRRGPRGMLGLGLSLRMGAGGKKLDPMFKALIALLPDKDDAKHLYHAAKSEVQYFLTTDKKTILNYRNKIKEICDVKALSPQEFMDILV
jgi:predicted nucleic acid-binding protein